MPKQFALPLTLEIEDSFTNFFVGDRAERGVCIESLKMQYEPAGDFLVYIWGRPASGKSHLLKAAAHWGVAKGAKVSFCTAKQLRANPSIINHITYHSDTVLIDDFEQLVGHVELETQLFAMYNSLRDMGKRLVITANHSPRELPCALADLSSRLSWGSVFRTVQLSDEELILALSQRSAARGLTLADDVASFIFYHAPRDANVLFDALDQLDALSLEAQRKLTIPFVKSAMNW